MHSIDLATHEWRFGPAVRLGADSATYWTDRDYRGQSMRVRRLRITERTGIVLSGVVCQASKSEKVAESVFVLEPKESH